MATEATENALRKCQDPRICPHAFADAFEPARRAVREMTIAATELQYDLTEITDPDERQNGAEAVNQKIGALRREADKLRHQIGKVQQIAGEIERELPRIAERLEVDLPDK